MGGVRQPGTMCICSSHPRAVQDPKPNETTPNTEDKRRESGNARIYIKGSDSPGMKHSQLIHDTATSNSYSTGTYGDVHRLVLGSVSLRNALYRCSGRSRSTHHDQGLEMTRVSD
jgi:hypothetical protein